MPKSVAPRVTGEAARFIATEQAELEGLAARIPHQRPSAALIRRRRRDCYPEGGDCDVPSFPLFPWNPRGNARRPKRAMSVRQREAVSANLVAAQKARSSPQKTSQKASSADVTPSETNCTGNAGTRRNNHAK